MYKENYIEESIQALEIASQIYVRLNCSMQWAESQNNLGVAYSNKQQNSVEDNLQKAIIAFSGASQVYHLLGNKYKYLEAKFNLGIAYEKSNQLLAAYECFQETIEVVNFSRNIVFPSLDNGQVLTEIYGRNIPSKTKNYHNDIIDIININDNLIVNDVAGFIQGEILSDQEYKQKLNEINNHLYQSMVKICIKIEKYAEAVEYAERSKVRILLEMQAIKELNYQGQSLGLLSEDLQRIQKEIDEQSKLLAESTDPNHDKINQLRQEFLSKYPYKFLEFRQIIELTNEETVIVEWYILGNFFCIFIITKNNLKPLYLEFGESDLNKLIDWTREYLRDYYSNREQWQNSLETQLANLAQILHIDEILNSIPKTCDKLILIPHRYLHLFPLHALPVTNNTPKYLIDAFPGGVSYAPSCQILHQVQKYKRGKFDKFFAIQNPTEDLMAADMEVESIKNIFPNPEILSKENAKKGEQSEEKLEIAERVANSHHLFFSCHGSFNPNDPLKSGLKLADGTLTLEEIFRYFNLSECSLVTLSACETGQVQLDNTDEYISLTSGFLLAGSPSLYVSLWSVNAFSTAILLIKTYENLYHQPGKLALALNQAQIWVRDTDIQGFIDWTNQCHLLDDNWRQILQDCLEDDKATQGANAKIYQNPYHWAGFCAAGKGEQNMTNSIGKLEIFQQLIQEADLFINLRDALASLKDELTDNDEDNIKIIENWLQDKPAIKRKYNTKLMNVNKGIAGSESDTKPGEKTESLIKIIEQAVQVDDTDKSSPKPPPSV
ncbi:CHAT domain-containing protein [Microcoleus sp. FACHB-831]|uniref:CHAT domain-containing protein n=1 Tax=Microcoleus sp. FACHB-831 TaxID=2692827 RepID=UPI00168805AE|nr:CHAT domain-containing protein [Microcoleus sp. FACHB-831]MBD1920768.1 CHAT domain-containing protein [Microcoleus sp. FACHB-831]